MKASPLNSTKTVPFLINSTTLAPNGIEGVEQFQ